MKILLTLMIVWASIFAENAAKVTKVTKNLDDLFTEFAGRSFIWIDINTNGSIGVLRYIDEEGVVIRQTKISSGAARYRTPSGTFKVYYKKRYHMSTKYPDDYGVNNMNHSLFFKGGFAIHSGNPRQQSHGCIHVHPKDSGYIFKMAKNGTPVKITRTHEY